MATYSVITIIYNPKSTGGSKERAHELQSELQAALPKQSIELVATEYKGHAEALAYDLASSSKYPLLISVSGDGGYHDLVNGVMRARKNGATAVTGLVPTGNANDHFNSLHEQDFVKAVVAGKHRAIDVLRLEVAGPRASTHYAHSYIGLGLTPKAGEALNNATLNVLSEVYTTTVSYIKFRPVTLIVNNKLQRYQSLVFSNIDRMAKYLTLTKDSKIDDGKFEVSALQQRNKFLFSIAILRASGPGLTSTMQSKKFQFSTVRTTLIQLDGEIVKVAGDSTVTVFAEHKVHHCIV